MKYVKHPQELSTKHTALAEELLSTVPPLEENVGAWILSVQRHLSLACQLHDRPIPYLRWTAFAASMLRAGGYTEAAALMQKAHDGRLMAEATLPDEETEPLLN